MTAEIITIGDEILIGQIVDTNSAWIGEKFNECNIEIVQIRSVSDKKEAIADALSDVKADVIVITGGLGPTKDDITKKALAEFFGVGFIRNQAALENVRKIFLTSNRALLEVNEQQADVPANCSVLVNVNGTAPGMWFEHLGKVYVSLPGVPFEMKYLVEEEVLPRLLKRLDQSAIYHRSILTAGIGESLLAQTIAPIEDNLPEGIKLAYLPKLGQVRLRLSGYGRDAALLKSEIEQVIEQIKKRIPEHVFAVEDIPLELALLRLMTQRGLTLSVAESCTGGYLSHLLTRHDGASRVFRGAAVSYSNSLKETMLGVSANTLAVYGAVSEEVVMEMLAGALNNHGSDYVIAITGIAGPGGGSEEKPVGTIWIAAGSRQKTLATKLLLTGRRLQNIERSAINAIVLLFKLLHSV